MRVMVIVKATRTAKRAVMPGQELLTAMGKYNEELVKAGVMLAGEGLHPTSKGKRVRFSGGKQTIIGWAVHRSQRTHRRVLAVAGAIHGRSHRMAQAQSF